ncbi:MAG: hypothetical protein B6242_16310 [Anaerolineaceae bacterium 4572_78]|nr:MAG: hypothetical protein B6242_16310 [Anaerolineaceae bacterium 4572_78]
MDKFISKSITIVIIGLIILGFLFFFSSQLMYIFAKVEEQETGIQFRGGQISNIVGPGIYSDFGLFVEMKRISRQGVSFSVTDPEINIPMTKLWMKWCQVLLNRR